MCIQVLCTAGLYIVINCFQPKPRGLRFSICPAISGIEMIGDQISLDLRSCCVCLPAQSHGRSRNRDLSYGLRGRCILLLYLEGYRVCGVACSEGGRGGRGRGRGRETRGGREETEGRDSDGGTRRARREGGRLIQIPAIITSPIKGVLQEGQQHLPHQQSEECIFLRVLHMTFMLTYLDT